MSSNKILLDANFLIRALEDSSSEWDNDIVKKFVYIAFGYN